MKLGKWNENIMSEPQHKQAYIHTYIHIHMGKQISLLRKIAAVQRSKVNEPMHK